MEDISLRASFKLAYSLYSGAELLALEESSEQAVNSRMETVKIPAARLKVLFIETSLILNHKNERFLRSLLFI